MISLANSQFLHIVIRVIIWQRKHPKLPFSQSCEFYPIPMLALDLRSVSQRPQGDEPVMQKAKGVNLKYKHTGTTSLTGATLAQLIFLTLIPSLENFKMD